MGRPFKLFISMKFRELQRSEPCNRIFVSLAILISRMSPLPSSAVFICAYHIEIIGSLISVGLDLIARSDLGSTFSGSDLIWFLAFQRRHSTDRPCASSDNGRSGRIFNISVGDRVITFDDVMH